MESREGRIQLSKDFRTIGLFVEAGGLFILPNVTCAFTHKFAPLFLLYLVQRSHVGYIFKSGYVVNGLVITEGQLLCTRA